MFSHILVPLDGSPLAECVLPHLVSISRVGQPDVTLLRVLDPSTGSSARPVDPFDWQIQKAEADAYLRAICGRLEESGVKASSVILEGKAAETIIEYARDNKVDLALMSSHGQSGISGWNISSVVQKILLRVRTSIMIVRAYQPLPVEAVVRYRHILLPLDGSPRAEVVLPVATALARANDSEVIAVHIVQKTPIPRRMPPSTDELGLVEKLTELNRLEANNYLVDLKDRFETSVDTRLMVADSPIRALHQLAEKEEIDLTILSAHGYTGEAEFPYGSVVISFLSYGSSPLLVIQDLPSERLAMTPAEIAAQQQGRR